VKAVFLDRDGTVTVGTPTIERVDSPDKAELLPNTLEALKLLAKLDYAVFFVTNQMSLFEKRITVDQFHQINDKILGMVAPSGIKVSKTYFCPHGPDEGCKCYKPAPGMLLDAAREYGIDLSQSWMVGDRPSDVMTAVNAGAKGILVKTGDPSAESKEAAFTASSLLEAVQYIADHS
jgi:D-glycero-D-manno-heptose 1,7-bisphosphate phosphatase